MKRNKGITLIALVISIIVILILAGVSISMIAGDNSIMKNAAKTPDFTKIGDAKDRISLKIQEYTLSYFAAFYQDGGNYIGGSTLPENSLGAIDDAIEYTKAHKTELGIHEDIKITWDKTARKLTIEAVENKVIATFNEKGEITWGTIGPK